MVPNGTSGWLRKYTRLCVAFHMRVRNAMGLPGWQFIGCTVGATSPRHKSLVRLSTVTVNEVDDEVDGDGAGAGTMTFDQTPGALNFSRWTVLAGSAADEEDEG